MRDELPSVLFSVEAEQQLIGAVLSNNELFDQVSRLIDPKHFWEPLHGDIWKNIQARISRDHLVSPVTLKTDMAQHEGLNSIGGSSYLVNLVAGSISSFAVKDYANHVRELHDRRTFAARLHQVADEVEGGRSADDAAAELELTLHQREGDSDDPRAMSFLKAQIRSLEQMQQIQNGEMVSVPTGIAALDDVVSFMPKRYTVLGGSTSMGKAQPLDSRVLGVHGWMAMGDVQIGDELASVDGAPSHVTGVFPQGEKEIFKVTFSDGRFVRCCGEHLWQTHGPKRTQDRVMSTHEIAEKLKLSSKQGRLSVPLFSGDFGLDADFPISPWLLGAFIGDGHMHGATPKFSIADAELLWRVMEEVSPEHVMTKDSGYDYRVKAAEGEVNNFALALRDLGYYRCRSEEKFIPDQYLMGSLQVRSELLKGLLDTDGWVEAFGAVRYSTSSPTLAKQVRELVWSLGGVCSVSEKTPKFTYKGARKFGQNHFVLNIRLPDVRRFISLTKKSRRCNRTKPVRLTVVSVEPDGKEQAQCIAVSHPSHLYVTDGYAVTHNTALALSIALAAAKAGYGVGFDSLEMPEEDLANRINSAQSLIPYKAYDRPMSETVFRKVIEAGKELESLPFEIFSERVRDVPAILSEGKRLKRKMKPNGPFKGFKLLIIDYVQLVRGKGESATVRLSQVANDLKQVAKQLDVHVLALAQIDRNISKEEDYQRARPRLADLRGSGDLEFAPDNVMFVFRPEYYLTRQNPPKDIEARADWEAEIEQWKGKAEIIVGKARMGEIGSVRVGCDMATNRFFDLPDQQDDMAF